MAKFQTIPQLTPSSFRSIPTLILALNETHNQLTSVIFFFHKCGLQHMIFHDYDCILSLERFRAVDMTFEGRSKSSIMAGLARSVAGWRVVRLFTRPNDPLTIDRRSTTALISRVKPRNVSWSGLLCDGSCLRRLKCQLTRDDRRPTVRPA